MAQYVLPLPGFYVFPAWQLHSVAPIRGGGGGERMSLAFNVVAVPNQVRLPMPTPETAHVSLSMVQRNPGGFA